MAKRTVTRWVSDTWIPSHTGFDKQGYSGVNKQIEVTYDDGEPEGKCPCESLEPSRLGCCRVGSDNHCACCKGYGGDRPCLSDWHKKAEPATRERVLHGFVSDKDSGLDDLKGRLLVYPKDEPGFSRLPVTVTVREPVKEQTLVEAVEALVKSWDEEASMKQVIAGAALRAALAREKAKVSRP